MASRKVTYNIPGIGNLSANLFDYTQKLYSFLDDYGHICRFRRINQLGRIRDVFQGAHHNRYEYVFLQLSIISELCGNKRSELGLSGTRQFCGKLDEIENFPSTGELLQCLVLLNNMGYLEGTFSTARAWITELKTNKSLYLNFRKGLDKQDRSYFQYVLDHYDYYNFNVVLALFQLQRYKRKGNDYIDFSSSILRTYISPSRENIHEISLIKLYDSIRQIAFITLDSIYAPVPFNLDLSSVLLNLDNLIDSLFINNTTYKIALRNLEQVLQDSVYMCPDSCINTARASEEKLLELKIDTSEIGGISDISKIVCPSRNERIEIEDVSELDWLKERKIIHEFRLRHRDWESLPKEIQDEVQYEIATRTKIGTSRTRVGLLVNSRKNTIKIAFGITTTDNTQSLIAALKITNEINKLKNSIPQYPYFNHNNNDENAISFICKSIFGWNKRFIFENKNRREKALLISNGKMSMIKQIENYLSNAAQFLNNDELFEVKKIKDLVETVNYSGLTIAYLGGTKLFLPNKNQESAEFDGLVIFPNINPKNVFAYIIEAKNYNNGVNDAKTQLNDRLGTHLLDIIEMNIQELNNRAAFAEIKIKSP